jgi:hypothetical protein
MKPQNEQGDIKNIVHIKTVIDGMRQMYEKYLQPEPDLDSP